MQASPPAPSAAADRRAPASPFDTGPTSGSPAAPGPAAAETSSSISSRGGGGGSVSRTPRPTWESIGGAASPPGASVAPSRAASSALSVSAAAGAAGGSRSGGGSSGSEWESSSASASASPSAAPSVGGAAPAQLRRPASPAAPSAAHLQPPSPGSRQQPHSFHQPHHHHHHHHHHHAASAGGAMGGCAASASASAWAGAAACSHQVPHHPLHPQPHAALHAARSSPNMAARVDAGGHAGSAPSAPPLPPPPYPHPGASLHWHAASAGGAAASPGGLTLTAPGTPSYMCLPPAAPGPALEPWATAAAGQPPPPGAAAAAAAAAAPAPFQRLSSPGWPPHLPAHVPLSPPHSASTGGAAPPQPPPPPAPLAAASRPSSALMGGGPSSASSTHLPPPPTALQPFTPPPGTTTPCSGRLTRTTVDDVEAGTHDQAATSGGSGSGGSGRAGSRGPSGPSDQSHHKQQQATAAAAVTLGAAVAGGTTAAAAAVSASAAAAVAAEEGTSALAPTAIPMAAPGAAAAAAAAGLGTPPPPLHAAGSRVEVSVSVLEPQPSLGRPVSASAVELAALGSGATGAAVGGAAATAAVGVPILLLSAGSAGAAAAAAAAAAVGSPVVPGVVLAAGVPEPGADGVDVVATLLASGAPRRRLGTSGGGGTDLDETSGGGAAVGEGGDGGGDGGGGDPGPCALPAEVRRRLRSHLGRHRMKRIRTWKDLAHSTASPRPGYWLLGSMALLGVLLTAFYFMAGQWEFLRPVDVSGPAEALVPPPPPPPAGAAPGGSVALGEPSSGAGVNMTSSSSLIISGNLTAVTNMGTAASTSTSSINVEVYVTDPYAHNWGPDALWDWLAFWKPSPARTFGFSYLRAWGGRYCPDLAAGQWWRWLTGLLLHQSALHLVSNLALLLVLATYLEALYGFWRVLPVFFVAGIAGNMVSAWLEDPCTLVVGASGAVFGLLGAYTADAALNWESIPLLWLRLAGMALVVGFMLALQLADHARSGGGGAAVSHASHAGGFVAGALLAWLLLPDFKARRCAKVTKLLTGLGLEAHLPPLEPPSAPGRQLYSFWQRHRLLTWGLHGVAVCVLVLQLVGVPAYLYTHTFKHLDCGADW